MESLPGPPGVGWFMDSWTPRITCFLGAIYIDTPNESGSGIRKYGVILGKRSFYPQCFTSGSTSTPSQVGRPEGQLRSPSQRLSHCNSARGRRLPGRGPPLRPRCEKRGRDRRAKDTGHEKGNETIRRMHREFLYNSMSYIGISWDIGQCIMSRS